MARKLMYDFQALYSTVPVFEGQYAEQLGIYYIDFPDDLNGLNRLISGFDKNGVPLNKPYIDVKEKIDRYYPISIGQYGLAVFHSWIKTCDISKKEHFLRIADWFVQNHVHSPGQGTFWLTNVPKPEYGVAQPWKSAFTQSRAISILLRAWQLTKDEKYLNLAEQALILFSLDISEGGVSVDRQQGATFYEEYVAAKPTRVLDGHLFSLFGLWDYVRAVPPERSPGHTLAKNLFEEGIDGLKKQFPLFDMGFWLRFNRCELPGYPADDPCTIGYLKLIIAQVEIMYRIHGDSFFQQTAAHLSTYLRPANILRMYRFKAKALKKLNRI